MSNSSGSLTWPTQTKRFLPKKIFIIIPQIFFSKEQTFHTHFKKWILHPRKRFFISNKITNFLSEKISYAYPKKTIFQTKKFLILKNWKTNFLYLREKVKALYFRCVSNTALLFFMLRKLGKVLNKLIRVLSKKISHFLFKKYCHFLFFSSSEGS